MNEPLTNELDEDDARFADDALSMLAPVPPSEALVARIRAIPGEHPRARVIEVVFRRSSMVALAAAALLGLLTGGLVDLDLTTTSEPSALDLPYGFDWTNGDLEGLDP